MSNPFDQAYWDDRYSAADDVWSGAPNPVLVSETLGLPAGSALDIGCGEGADAIWLASRGWQVTATDFSAVALQRAAAHSRRAADDPATSATIAGRIQWEEHDFTRWAPRPVPSTWSARNSCTCPPGSEPCSSEPLRPPSGPPVPCSSWAMTFRTPIITGTLPRLICSSLRLSWPTPSTRSCGGWMWRNPGRARSPHRMVP